MLDCISMSLPRVPPVHRGCVQHLLQLHLKPFPPSLIMYGAPSRAACQVIGTRFATSALPVALARIQTKSIYRQAEYLVEGGRGAARGGAVGRALPYSYTPRVRGGKRCSIIPVDHTAFFSSSRQVPSLLSLRPAAFLSYLPSRCRKATGTKSR